MTDWLGLFLAQIKETGVWQWLAVVFGVTEVFLAKANNVWLYPAGIIATLISFFLLMEVDLYAEAVLNLYYLVMSIYGWYYWIYKRHLRPEISITKATPLQWVITLTIALGGWLVLYLILKHFTPSDVPVWDAFVSSTAWAGMWLLAKRKLENWILLNISNLVAIPLLYQKQLAMFAVLTVVLFIVAVFGYFNWLSIYKKEQSQKSVAALS